jgi:pre-rRNA-processing protein IPI1
MNSVCSRLIPYFTISHPTRGELPGPYCKLPGECRRLVLDVVATLSSLPNVQTGDLCAVVEKALSEEDDLKYYAQTSLSQ